MGILVSKRSTKNNDQRIVKDDSAKKSDGLKQKDEDHKEPLKQNQHPLSENEAARNGLENIKTKDNHVTQAQTEHDTMDPPEDENIPQTKDGDTEVNTSESYEDTEELHTSSDLDDWLRSNVISNNAAKQANADSRDIGTWTELRLFISSTFVDTQAERDTIVKRIIPSINRKLASQYIRIVPVDLRWGVLAEESKDCKQIQKTCLNQVDKCRPSISEPPWFLGVRTQRYGWVQNDLLSSEGFENPELYSWMDSFEKFSKQISITSLESIHAAQEPTLLTPSPTVFFYDRKIKNPSNIEEDMRWVFDFEYVQTEEDLHDDVKYQYCKTADATAYKKDRNDLNDFLKSLPHVSWNEYTCNYEKGGALITCKRENAKSFGVGYVDDLEKFADAVEKDLLAAVRLNLGQVDMSTVPTFQLETINHVNAVKVKAAGFVGRSELQTRAVEHCNDATSDVNLMILHGEPGCGKSGLLSSVVEACISTKDEHDFTFIHIVDSCPGSNVLEKMLQRLQLSLRQYRRSAGESNISMECPESSADLKAQHHQFLEETAEKYPDRKFLLVVDAVNQFHSGLQAWTMWWLPSTKSPPNLRFLISTLNEENSTFAYAREMCPQARLMPVDDMSHDDLQEMVTSVLLKFNKRLTTNDDPILGNQMELLLSKSSNPLYLIAACEALRKFGIFEKVSEYIASLPSDISSLFNFLLDEWSEEYGELLIADIAGILCISKDGLLENQVNDILRFKESKMKKKGESLYESSFSLLYDSLCSFLAAGGGGYLRYFHDQLKYTVRRKFLADHSGRRELELQKWLAEFFFDVVSSQLCESPVDEAVDYYEHSLQQVVFHQLCAEDWAGLQQTLHNVYFVRERIIKGHQQALINEYNDAIERCSTNAKEMETLRQWQKFVQLYSHHIVEFSEFGHNMALNQAPQSSVCRDTQELPSVQARDGYPLYWWNIPQEEDAMAAKYSVEGTDSAVDCAIDDDFCVMVGDGAIVFDRGSGAVLHKLNVKGHTVCIESGVAWIGSSSGDVTSWDLKTGSRKSAYEGALGNCIVWVECFRNIVMCGTGSIRGAICWDNEDDVSDIAIIDESTGSITEKWSTEINGCFCYCFESRSELIFSGHLQGVICGWSTNGEQKMKFTDASEVVYSLAAHPTEGRIVSGSNDHVIRIWDVTSQSLAGSVQDYTDSGWGFGGDWAVCYDAEGDRIFSSEPQSESVRIWKDGVMQAELKGHSACIKKIKSLPTGEKKAVSCDRAGCMVLWNLPDGPQSSVETIKEKVLWCGFIQSGEEFVTVSDGFVRMWSAMTCLTRTSTPFDGFYRSRGVIYDEINAVLCTGKMDVTLFSLTDLSVLHTFTALDTDDGSTTAMSLSADFTKLLVTECRNSNSEESVAKVFDISNYKQKSFEQTTITTYTKPCARLFSCDIHPDNELAVTGGHAGTHVWEMTSGNTLHHIDSGCFHVQFVVSGTVGVKVLYTDGNQCVIRDFERDEDTATFKGHTDGVVNAQFINGGHCVLTASEDGTLRMFEVATGTCVYAFVNHRAQQFGALAVQPQEGGMVVAGNNNELLYVLRTVYGYRQ